ncbi:MAG: transglutaminase-like domain-containing protein [Acidobacteriota bacterium]
MTQGMLFFALLALAHSATASASRPTLDSAANSPSNSPAHCGESPADSQWQGSPWLAPTSQIDCDHPSIQRLAQQLGGKATGARQKAVAIHRFVRDEIAFGWAPEFYQQRASETLATGRGYCNTKGPLFVALLRASGIPARLRFIELRSEVLGGLVDTGGPYVDHAYTEVWLEGSWVSVDSYVVDRSLAEAARQRLESTGTLLGYGIHRNGVSEWDGLGDSFVQFVDDGSVPGLSNREYGLFSDVESFYRQEPSAHNRKTWISSLALRVFLPSANRRIAKLRETSESSSP